MEKTKKQTKKRSFDMADASSWRGGLVLWRKGWTNIATNVGSQELSTFLVVWMKNRECLRDVLCVTDD